MTTHLKESWDNAALHVYSSEHLQNEMKKKKNIENPTNESELERKSPNAKNEAIIM